MFRFR